MTAPHVGELSGNEAAEIFVTFRNTGFLGRRVQVPDSCCTRSGKSEVKLGPFESEAIAVSLDARKFPRGKGRFHIAAQYDAGKSMKAISCVAEFVVQR